jgi:protein-disulfide isomerase
MTEHPAPIPPLGASRPPAEPYALHRPPRPPAVVDLGDDLFGAEPAAARLAEQLADVHGAPVRVDGDGVRLLSPAFEPGHDRVDGIPTARVMVVAFGAHASPWSRTLGSVLQRVRDDHPTVAVAWRHYPDPVAHPRAGLFALAAEAAAAGGHFWALTRVLLSLRHHDAEDLHAAVVRAGLDPHATLAAMRAGAGSDRIVQDVTSARASAVIAAPALFINGRRYDGRLDPEAVSAAVRRSSA